MKDIGLEGPQSKGVISWFRIRM